MQTTTKGLFFSKESSHHHSKAITPSKLAKAKATLAL